MIEMGRSGYSASAADDMPIPRAAAHTSSTDLFFINDVSYTALVLKPWQGRSPGKPLANGLRGIMLSREPIFSMPDASFVPDADT